MGAMGGLGAIPCIVSGGRLGLIKGYYGSSHMPIMGLPRVIS